jgi:hypothetical protein
LGVAHATWAGSSRDALDQDSIDTEPLVCDVDLELPKAPAHEAQGLFWLIDIAGNGLAIAQSHLGLPCLGTGPVAGIVVRLREKQDRAHVVVTLGQVPWSDRDLIARSVGDLANEILEHLLLSP